MCGACPMPLHSLLVVLYIHAVLSAAPFNTDAATSKHRMRNVATWHGRIIHAGSFEVGQP